MTIELFLLMLIVFCAYIVGATTGFGSAIITLTFALHIYPVEFLIPLVVPLNIMVCTYLAVRHKELINWKILFKRIIPFSIIGVPFGLLFFNLAGSESLKLMFGIFVLVVASLELIRLKRSGDDPVIRPLSGLNSFLWLFGGGVVQGIWVSAGPIIAYWAGRNFDNKGEFRATLCFLWILMNLALLICHLVTGIININTMNYSLIMIPFVGSGLLVGEWFHKKLNEKAFKIFVYIVLIFAGASILMKSL